MSGKMEAKSEASEQAVKDDCPFSPTTGYKKLKEALSEIDDLVTFNKFEEMSNFEGEYKSLQLSIKDANAANLQEEIVQLKDELKQCKDSSEVDKKEANIKLFRLQQELEQKNIEILLLKKNKSEFDLQINLLKSRCARKEKDLQDALNVSHPGSTETKDAESEISKLKSEIDKLKTSQDILEEDLKNSKWKIDHLEEILKIKSNHIHLLSLAFDELLNDFKVISTDVSDIIESMQNNDPFSFDSLEPIDLTTLDDITNIINIQISPFNVEEYVYGSETIEVDVILKEAVSNLTSWFNAVLDEWQSHIQDSKIPDNNDIIDELKTIYHSLRTKQLSAKTQSEASTNDAATSMIITNTNEISLQTSFTVNTNNYTTEEDNNLAVEVEELKNKLIESKNKFENLTNDFENRTSALRKENEELLQKYNSTKDILLEAEKQQSFVEETTAEVVKELKDELGDRTVNMLLNGGHEEIFVDVILKEESQLYQTSGMTTFLSAKEEPERSIYEDRDVTSAVSTAYALPREHSDNLVSFAQEFAEFLLANQVFHPDDEPPTDPSVFYFLLDKYLMLVETYHQARTVFEENFNELEEQDKVSRIKAEALLSQLSQLEVTDSTLCDTSLTASSVDFDVDVRSSTMCENKLNNTSLNLQSFAEINDLTHDPLQITISNNVPSTPVAAKSRLSFRDGTPAQRRNSFNNSKIPISRSSASTETLRVRHSILLNGSVNESKLPPSTPVQKILRREPCSTAKKSVTFQSPLLARNAIEYENSRLKTVLDDKLSQIDKLECSIANHVSIIAKIEKRVIELEQLSSDAYNTLERAENEFSEKREKIEDELNHAKSQLTDVTNKLIVEAINLNPDLQDRLTAITPPQVLKILLDTIIARCQKEQEETKKTFENDREEWSNEMLLLTTTNQCLQLKLDELKSQNKQMGLQCDELVVIEEDLLRLTTENIQLERTNANLQKISNDLQEKLLKLETVKQEIIILKDKLFMAEAEKECLISDKSQLEEDKEKLGTEYDKQLKVLEDAIVTKNDEVRLLNDVVAELRNNMVLLEEAKDQISKEHENHSLQKDKILSSLREELDSVKNQLLILSSQNADSDLVKSTEDANRVEEFKSLKLELENSKKDHLKVLEEKNHMLSTLQGELDGLKTHVITLENQIADLQLAETNAKKELENHMNILETKNAALLDELDSLKKQVETLETEIADLHLSKTNADNNRIEELESLKLELENTKKEQGNHMNVLETKNADLLDELDLLKKQVVSLELKIADLHLSKTNADNNRVEEMESLKLELENSIKEHGDNLKILEEKDQKLTTLQEELVAVKKQVIKLENEIADLQLVETNAANSKVEELESLKLELENSKKDHEDKSKILEEKNQMLSTLQEELEAVKKQLLTLNNQVVNLNEIKTTTDTHCNEELESLKLALENSTKEKECLESEKVEFQSSLTKVSAEKDDADNNIKMAESAIEAISEKFMCDNILPGDLASKINYLCNLVAKKLADLVEENKRISLLEKEIADVKDEKEQMNVLLKEVQIGSEMLQVKVLELEDNKCNIESELTQLKQRIVDMEDASNKLQNEIQQKDEMLLNHTAELELFKIKIAEKAVELESNEEKLLELNQLQEQKLLVDAKQVEINNLQADNNQILNELNCLKSEKETILSQISTCTLQYESEVEKHKETSLNIGYLQKEVDSLKEELVNVRTLEGTHKTEMDVITIEKSKLEECLSGVEQNLRLAEERLLSAEAINSEFEAELLLLKDELVKNKMVTEELSVKLSELETIHGNAKSDKASMTEQLDQLTSLNNSLNKENAIIKEQLNKLMGEKDKLLTKLTDISQAKVLLEEEKNSLIVKLEELKQTENRIHAEYNSLTKTFEELTTLKTTLLTEKDCLTNQLDCLKKSNDSLSHDKEEINVKLSELTGNYNSEKNELIKQINELQEIKNGLVAEKENLLKDLTDANLAVNIFNEEKEEFARIKESDKNENDMLNIRLSELSQARESLQVEKDLLTTKITELRASLNGYNTEKDSLFNELQTVIEDRRVLVNENKTLQTKLTENEDSIKILTEEKSILITKLDEITQSRDILVTENHVFASKIQELTKKVETLTNDLEEKSQNITELVKKLEFFDTDNEKLKENLEEYKKTESTMLKKLLEKNSSDEMVYRLQSQLKDAECIITRLNTEVESMHQELKNKTNSLESTEFEFIALTNEVKHLKAIINNLTKDNDELNNNFNEQSKELRFKSQSLDDVTTLMENLKCQVSKKEQESEEVNSLLNQREDKINNLNNQMEILSSNNAELKELLSHVQVALGLPQEAIQLAADQNTRSCLRLFKDKVDGVKTRNQAISVENEKLIIELEKLTTEKVQFKIKEAEFLSFGREMDDKIQDLTNKLTKLQSAPNRRSKRQDPIGPRRLEKLEELNTTLHDLLMKLLTMLQMPNVDKLRLISQREVDGATKQILDHAAALANARDSLEALKEQVKSLDQENQELSDNFEALLKDNNKLELQIVELSKSHKSSACSDCVKLRKSLKDKTDEVDELNSKVKELDEENESLSNDVEALLKDNNKLEMQLIEIQKGADSIKSCSACSAMKKDLKIKEVEMTELELTMKKNAEHLQTVENELDRLKAKCEELESSLSNKEQHLLRAINERVRGDEVRMSGVTGGMVRDIDLNEKLRRLTKDNDALKVLLRERARTIKKYESEQKSSHITNTDTNAVMNTNCMDSPIRDRSYNLRTRADMAIVNKRSLRPHSEGIENIRI